MDLKLLLLLRGDDFSRVLASLFKCGGNLDTLDGVLDTLCGCLQGGACTLPGAECRQGCVEIRRCSDRIARGVCGHTGGLARAFGASGVQSNSGRCHLSLIGQLTAIWVASSLQVGNCGRNLKFGHLARISEMLLDRPSVGEFSLQHRIVRILSERGFANSNFLLGRRPGWSTFTDHRMQTNTHQPAKRGTNGTLFARSRKVEFFTTPELLDNSLASFLTVLLGSLARPCCRYAPGHGLVERAFNCRLTRPSDAPSGCSTDVARRDHASDNPERQTCRARSCVTLSVLIDIRCNDQTFANTTGNTGTHACQHSGCFRHQAGSCHPLSDNATETHAESHRRCRTRNHTSCQVGVADHLAQDAESADILVLHCLAKLSFFGFEFF